MALRNVAAVLLLALALTNIDFSAGSVVKGNIACLDCYDHDHPDLSGIKVMVKCDNIGRPKTATTNGDGYYEAELPLAPATRLSSRCLVKLLGGTRQLYAARNGMVSGIVQANDNMGRQYFTTSTPLTVSMACPREMASNCAGSTEFGSSKTIDLPIPREWGLAPTSYYVPTVPFIPIIGIP